MKLFPNAAKLSNLATQRAHRIVYNTAWECTLRDDNSFTSYRNMQYTQFVPICNKKKKTKSDRQTNTHSVVRNSEDKEWGRSKRKSWWRRRRGKKQANAWDSEEKNERYEAYRTSSENFKRNGPTCLWTLTSVLLISKHPGACLIRSNMESHFNMAETVDCCHARELKKCRI